MAEDCGNVGARERLHEVLILLFDGIAMIKVCGVDLAHYIDKRGHTITCFIRKISASKEWRLVWHEKHSQRPSTATLRKQMVRELIDFIEIWALFAVNFDIDVKLIHDLRYRRIFE